MADPPDSPSMAVELFSLADRELWLVTSQTAAARGGLIATFVCHASLPPELPRVLLAVAKHHFTWSLIEASGAFTLHLLGEEHLELVWRFGMLSGRDVDKFSGLTTETGFTHCPRLPDTLGWADCRVETRWDSGDRSVYLAEVCAAAVQRHTAPLTMKRLISLAPAEKLQQLRTQREQDGRIDAAAILAWRALAIPR